MEDNLPDKSQVIMPPPLLFGIFLLVGLLLNYLWPIGFLPQSILPFLTLALFAASALIGFHAHQEMARLKTPVNTSRPATALATNGPFRFSRNPLYVSLMLVYLGFAVLFNSLWLFALAFAFFFVLQRGVIEREEFYLERKFGDDYRQYKARVRRWV